MRALFRPVAMSAGIISIASACILQLIVTHHVTAVFTGRSCQVSLDGLDVTDHGRSFDFEIAPKLNEGAVPGLAAGHTSKLVVCGDLDMVFEGPRDSLPARGIYRVVRSGDAATPPGMVTVRLQGNFSNAPRPDRRWPASMLEQGVDGVSGTLRLDRITQDSVFGRVEMVGRAHVKYP
ncbi:MAG: hypothetical protein ACREN6_11675 [Gemmatimonadaceae bacterium]